MVKFQSSYSPMQEEYFATLHNTEKEERRIEDPITPPIVPAEEVGVTVVDIPNRQTFISEVQGAMRQGASRMELAAQAGGPGQAAGFASYGEEARQALRELQSVNQLQFSSVHVPSNFGNMSGWGERGFDETHRKTTMDEVKQAISFAADVNQGGAVVVHTGEFTRPISEQSWAKRKGADKEQYQFVGYLEEPGRAVLPVVDKRTGEFIGGIRKSEVYRLPKYIEAEKDEIKIDEKGNKVQVRKGDWIDKDGFPIDPMDPTQLRFRRPDFNFETQTFKTKEYTWDEIEDMRKRMEKRREEMPHWKEIPKQTEELALHIKLANQYASARGSALFHSRHFNEHFKSWEKLKKEYERQKEIEGALPEDEKWMETITPEGGRLLPSETKMKSDAIKEAMDREKDTIEQIYESSASSDVNAEEVLDRLQWAAPAYDYAIKKSSQSLAEAGIHAWQQTERKKLDRDVFVAPENIFPQQYGSHPQELINIVKKSREKMVELLTEKEIEDPHQRTWKNPETNEIEIRKWKNPNFIAGMSKEKAEKIATDHIKATIDTEHLGFWRTHWVPKPGQNKQETDAEFNEWFLKQVEELADEDIVGHMHFLDSIEGAHQHVPAGQGELPLKEAVKLLKEKIRKKGGDFTVMSEGYADNFRFGRSRQLTETWKTLGSPIYKARFGAAPAAGWGQIQDSYAGWTQPPFYIVGAYSPSNEWKLWTEVPFE